PEPVEGRARSGQAEVSPPRRSRRTQGESRRSCAWAIEYCSMQRRMVSFVASAVVLCVPAVASSQNRLQSSELLKLRSVNAVQLSPDATRVAYVVESNDGPGRPYGQLSVMTLADGKSVRFGGDKESSDDPHWSPDGQWIAYRGRVGGKAGLVVAKPDGTGARLLAEMPGTNAPLPGAGNAIAWSPDGKRIA